MNSNQSMPLRPLGRSGLVVPAIGLGCLPLTGFYGTVSKGEALRVLGRALDLGVSLLDTADVYAGGENERLVGAAIKGRRDEAVVATKFGQRYDGDRFIGPCGRPEYVRESCHASLARLGTETIDLYQLHRVDPATPIEETVGAMHELVLEGKVRFLGLSEARPSDIRRAASVAPIATLQSEYSLLERSVEREVLDVCHELGIGFLAYAPLLRGLLARRFARAEELEPDDPRRLGLYPRVADEALEQNLKLVETVEEIAARHGASASQVALSWLLSRPALVVPIPGSKRVEHVEQNVGAASLVLDDSDLRRLDALVPAGGGGAGERYPPGRAPTHVSPPRMHP